MRHRACNESKENPSLFAPNSGVRADIPGPPLWASGRLWTALSALHTARFTEQRRKPCRGHGRLTGGLSIFGFATAAVAGISSAYRRCRKQWHRRGRSSNRRSILGFAAVTIGISVGGAARHEQREHQCCDFHDTPLDGFERL